MNLLAWIKNYEKVILKKIQFNVKEWVKNYQKKILEPKILDQEIKELKRIEENYQRSQREALRKLRDNQNKMIIKHQREEVEAIKRVRLEERRWDIPLYCAAPAGGAFKIEEAVGKREWLSVDPTVEWMNAFGKKSRSHIPLVQRGESLFMAMKDNVDDGFFEDFFED